MNINVRSCLFAAWTAGVMLTPAPVFAHRDPPHDESASVIKEQTSWGIAGDVKPAQRIIEVSMGDDMRFTPARIHVNNGKTVRIAIRNTGKLLHEFVIGTRRANQAHAALMMKFPNMQHDEPHMAHVQPGQSAEIVWTFNRPGTFEFACLIAGHYQAGMVGAITVASAKGGKP